MNPTIGLWLNLIMTALTVIVVVAALLNRRLVQMVRFRVPLVGLALAAVWLGATALNAANDSVERIGREVCQPAWGATCLATAVGLIAFAVFHQRDVGRDQRT